MNRLKRLRRALGRANRRERRANFVAEKQMLAQDHRLHTALYAAGMRPTVEPDGSVLWEQPTLRGQAN